MSSLPARISSNVVRSVAAAIIPKFDEADSESVLVLSIRIENEDLVARDFAAFMELIDHVYGRALSAPFGSYARREHGHFAFTHARPGSWELIAEQALGVGSRKIPYISPKKLRV